MILLTFLFCFVLSILFLPFYAAGMSIDDLREYEARMQAETNKKLGVNEAATPQ